MEPSPTPIAPEPARERLLRRVLEGVGVTALLFVVRFMVAAPLPAVLPSGECYTGGIARDVLGHGLRFPLLAYVPFEYELGIFIEGLLATPFFAALGPNALALKLVPFAFYTAATLASLALLSRLVPARARLGAGLVLLVPLAFGPMVYLLKTSDALGDHNEATALSMVVLWLLVRRLETPRLARVLVTAAAAAGAAWWQKATLVVALLVALAELWQALRGKNPRRWLAWAAGAAAVGTIPGMLASWAFGFSDVHEVAGIFRGGDLLAMVQRSARWAWAYYDMDPVRLGLAVLGLGYLLVRGARSLRGGDHPAATLVGGYAAAHLLLVLLARPDGPPRYHLYLYAAACVGLAALVANAASRVRVHPAIVLTSAAVVLALALRPAVTFRPRHPLDLARDEERAHCEDRFGRGFSLQTPTTEDALELCRSLEGSGHFDCLAGIGARNATAGALTSASSHVRIWSLLRAEERPAYAFGVGRGLAVSRGVGTRGCASLHIDEHWCEQGLRWNCLSYLYIQAKFLGPPRCPVEVPFDGYRAREADDWKALSAEAPDRSAEDARTFERLERFTEPACRAVLRDCLGLELSARGR